MLCSGDNKTEKAARSAQVALVDNGSMTDTLGFIEGTVIIIIMIPSASVISLNINLTDHKPEFRMNTITFFSEKNKIFPTM